MELSTRPSDRHHRLRRLQHARLSLPARRHDRRRRPEPAHIALNRLKLAAFRHLPGACATSIRFFGIAGEPHQQQSLRPFIAPNLDAATARLLGQAHVAGRRRIDVFDRNIYRTGLLGRFIGAGHLVARLHGVDLHGICAGQARCANSASSSTRRSRRCSTARSIRWITSRKSLAVRPRHSAAAISTSWQASTDGIDRASVLRQRLEKLACHFPLNDNYFAWQAFARRYPTPERRHAAGLSRRPRTTQPIRDNADRVRVHHANFTELLAAEAGRFASTATCLLDAQDWMTDEQLNDALDRDHPHRPPRRPRHLPHRRRKERARRAASRPALLDQWTLSEKSARSELNRDGPLGDLWRLPHLS